MFLSEINKFIILYIAGDFMNRDKKFKLILTVYFVLLLAVWTLNEFFLRTAIDSSFGDVMADIIKECAVKMTVWFVPAVLLIKKYNSQMEVKAEKLFRPDLKGDFKVFLPFFLFFTFYILLFKYRNSGGIFISENFSPANILVFFCVGLAEETVFRGWLLNGTLNKDNFKQTAFLNSLMFLAIHFPRWFKEGVFVSNMVSGGFISIIFLSIVFSYSFQKCRNLAVPILLHAWWDFLLSMIK